MGRESYNEANDRTSFMAPESRCIQKIDEKGFTDEFQIVSDHEIRCLNNQVVYRPQDISVINFYRFEGPSNPDDMSIIYVIETHDGRKGTLTDAYGIYADETIGEYMNKVESFQKITERAWR
jgi:hypothetical protein